MAYNTSDHILTDCCMTTKHIILVSCKIIHIAAMYHANSFVPSLKSFQFSYTYIMDGC